MTKTAARFVGIVLLLLAGLVTGLDAASWPEWRGPSRDGRSSETNLPAAWSPQGENLAWRVPIGGRSSPVVHNDRVYLLTVTEGDPATAQERLVALDAESGKLVWEHRFSIYLSDVPQHRAAWSSPSVDPASGTVYVLTVGAELTALSRDGKPLWTRSLPEEYGAITTHGGRTTSPIVEGDKVIINALLLGWGDLGRPGNRWFAFDKATGQTVWIASPQQRHYDTNFSLPIVVDLPQAGGASTRALIVGGTDGAFHALQVNTGKPIWSVDVSKRAILGSPLFDKGTVYLTHGEENIGTTEMGMVAALDGSGSGALTDAAFKWKTFGFLPTFASPVMDDQLLYVVDNSAIVAAFDRASGQRVWERGLGTLQKGSPVLADGKLYVGTENGKFFILQPSATEVKVLDEDWLGSQESPEVIVASPIVADGRVYVTSMDATYAIGKRAGGATKAGGPGWPGKPGGMGTGAVGPVAQVQLFPYEVLLAPGAKQAFQMRFYDAAGNLLSSKDAATWAVDQIDGSVAADGSFVAGKVSSAGYVKATVNGVTGQARVRVVEPLPWSYNFEAPKAEAAPMWWTGAPGKVLQRSVEGVGNVLVRPRDETVGRRARIMMGPATWDNYTVEADVRGREQRRQRGDAGLINQRYALVLFGNGQKLELHPWQAADEMTVRVPFAWKPDAWYRMKLRVDNQPDGKTLVRGKVWPTGDPEPEAWTVEKLDTIPHRMGSPGIYGDGISELYFDNVQVYSNK